MSQKRKSKVRFKRYQLFITEKHADEIPVIHDDSEESESGCSSLAKRLRYPNY